MNQPPPDPHWRAPREGYPYRGVPGGPGHQASGPSDPGERRYPLASWWSRVLARAVDMVAVALPALLVALVLALVWLGVLNLLGGSGSGPRSYGYFLVVTFFVLYTGYETLAVARWQQTLGKRLAGVKVAPAAAAGRLGPVPLAALTVRAALFGLPVLLFALPGALWWTAVMPLALLTGGMAAWDRPNQQGIHDKIAGTVVLDVS